MGGSQSVFDDQELNDYQELTYLKKQEIFQVYKMFQQLDPDYKSRRNTNKNMKDVRLSKEDIYLLPEIKENPFKDRITTVFSSRGDGSMTFEDFLEMMSVFSENASNVVKVTYAFKIYDFDDDDKISRSDLREVILRLAGNDPSQRIQESEIQRLVGHIMEEADLDHDGYLSFPEFDHVISKTPDFIK